MKFSTLTFISDLGTSDGYVGVVHSILHSLVPGLKIIDLSHDLEPFNTHTASLVLARAAEYLNSGIVIASVNPTQARPVVIEVGGGQSYLVGPDNGIFAPTVGIVGGATKAALLNNSDLYLDSPGRVSQCRDIYTPIAAELCKGVEIEKLGEIIDPVKLIPSVLSVSELSKDGSINSEVLWIDRFGNAQLNLDPIQVSEWDSELTLLIGNKEYGLIRIDKVSELQNQSLGFIVDAHGLCSLVLNQGSAAEKLNITEGSAIIIRNEQSHSLSSVSVSVELGKSASL